MALRKNANELPSDALILNEEEALFYQLKLIENWTPQSDVWPLKYSFGILGTLSGMTSFYINNHFRSKLRLGTYGRLATYIPNVILPTLLTSMFQNEAVTRKIILADTCPTCLEVRSAIIQLSFSIVYPIIITPLATFNIQHVSCTIGIR